MCVTLLLVMVLLPMNLAADGEDQCVKCHTSGRSLINVAREMADELGDQVLKSTESEGEG
jgi:hypothetical protein